MAAGIGSLTGAATSSAQGKTDTQAIAGNFQQFLTLLTTQLRNQNPLDPMDTNQFTQQLVQFAGVEQQLKTNNRFDALLVSSMASALSTASGFVGQTVTVDGKTTTLEEGKATWTLTPSRAASQATVTIMDADGNVVATKSTTLKAGAQTFSWDGRGSSSMTLPDGNYSIKIDALDTTGAPVTVDTRFTGKVDSVDLEGGVPILVIGGQRVPVSSVKALGGAAGA